MNDLYEKGWIVIPNVLDDETCNVFRKRAYEEKIHAHSDLMWDIRTHPSVLKQFELIWNTDDLIVGFDGMGVGFPFDLDWHTDQEFASEKCVCVQAILALTTADATKFVSESHFWHQNYIQNKTFPENKWQFKFVQVQENLMHIICPKLNPGDMLIWDSRTIHRVDSKNYIRIVSYLSMVPAKFASDEIKRQRRKFYESGIATTHWPQYIVDRGEMRNLPSKKYHEASNKIKKLIDGNNFDKKYE